MTTITDWLASLGLSEYAGRFAENGIDLSVVPDLTDQDLKDIGVLLGHRRKMLRAISGLARAVRAGLELIAAVRMLKTRASLQTRVGIATGLVMVGDLFGSGSRPKYTRMRGRLLLSKREHAAAENNYRSALEVAQRQGAKFWDLRAALDPRSALARPEQNAPMRAISSRPSTAGSLKALTRAT